MLQQKNNKIYFYLFCFFILSTIMNQGLLLFFKNNFLLKKIEINTNSSLIKNQIKLNTEYMINNNIFFLDENKILKKLDNLNFLENIKIQKNYPATLKITANKTKLLAVTYLDQKKYFIGNNEKFISAMQLNNNYELPIIFGQFLISDFLKLRKTLSKNNIDQDKIIKYYFHKNKRWDLYFKNNIVIKLPNKSIIKAIKLYKNFIDNNEIKPNSIIDLRVNNRLILSNG